MTLRPLSSKEELRAKERSSLTLAEVNSMNCTTKQGEDYHLSRVGEEQSQQGDKIRIFAVCHMRLLDVITGRR